MQSHCGTVEHNLQYSHSFGSQLGDLLVVKLATLFDASLDELVEQIVALCASPDPFLDTFTSDESNA
jgi:hypothetical protein